MNQNDRTIIIGIAGLARSGKDTVANFLQESLNSGIPIEFRNYDLYSFAAPLKSMIEVGLGLCDKDTRAESLYGKTYRHIAQTLGTEWGRNEILKSIWVDIAERNLQNKLTIISDVRFNDEAELCRKYGIMIHVTRPSLQTDLTEAEQGHSSEAGVDCLHGDYKVINLDTGLENLEGLVKSHVLNDVLELLAHKEAWKDPEPANPKEVKSQ